LVRTLACIAPENASGQGRVMMEFGELQDRGHAGRSHKAAFWKLPSQKLTNHCGTHASGHLQVQGARCGAFVTKGCAWVSGGDTGDGAADEH
jgi:hypothetical protein